MPPRASLARGLRWAAASAKAGGAALGLALVASSGSPEAVLGFLAVVLVVLGGTVWSLSGRGGHLVAMLVSLGTVVTARLVAGPAAAALTTAILVLGAVLRIRPAEGVIGLATFAGVLAVLGGASPRLIFAFWLVGFAILAVRRLTLRAWRALSRGLLSGMRDRRRASPS